MNSVRVTVEHVQGEDDKRRHTLFTDYKDVPAGMTAKRCAIWMLARATEQLTEPADTHFPQRAD